MKKIYLSPSLLAVKKEDFKTAINQVVKLGAKYIHFDVMDKKFIGHTSFNYEDFKKVVKLHKVNNDVHLMTMNPYKMAKEFAKLGADIITFHYEAFKSNELRYDCVNAIKKLGVKVGISFKPTTLIEKALPFLQLVDVVLIMSVEPGAGSQKFIDASLDRIRRCSDYIKLNNLKTLIEVDGGVNEITGPLCIKAGANILVTGSYLFKDKDIKSRYNKLVKKYA